LKNKSSSLPKMANKEEIKISAEKAISICFKHKVFIYPVHHLGSWYVEVDINGNKKRFQKAIGKGMMLCSKKPVYDKINWIKAIEETYIFYAKKLL
jgi:hypothetical protein